MIYDGIIDQSVEEYEARTGVKLDNHNRSVLRDIINKQNEFEERRESFVDR